MSIDMFKSIECRMSTENGDFSTESTGSIPFNGK